MGATPVFPHPCEQITGLAHRKTAGLYLRAVLFAFLRLAERHAAIDGQGFKNDVQAVAVLVLKSDAYFRPKAVFFAVFFVFADAVRMINRLSHGNLKIS